MSGAMAITKFEIDIFSDTICPYCYLGKKNLDRAIELYKAQHPDAEFVLTWVPFILHPKIKATYPKKAPFEARLGSDAERFYQRLDRVAAVHGTSINWEGVCGNSRDTHRLIMLAMEKDRLDAAREHNGGEEEEEEEARLSTTQDQSQSSSSAAVQRAHDPNATLNAVVNAVFRGIWEVGRDPSDHAFLAETAVTCGLAADEAAARRWLDEGEDLLRENAEDGKTTTSWEARLEAARTRAAEAEINGVPTYMVQGRYQIGGMQEPELFIQVFDKVREQEKNGPKEAGGKNISIRGKHWPGPF